MGVVQAEEENTETLSVQVIGLDKNVSEKPIESVVIEKARPSSPYVLFLSICHINTRMQQLDLLVQVLKPFHQMPVSEFLLIILVCILI